MITKIIFSIYCVWKESVFKNVNIWFLNTSILECINTKLLEHVKSQAKEIILPLPGKETFTIVHNK